MVDTAHSDEHFSIGQKLRRARLARGVSLDEVARVTRITKGYLLALEEDAQEKLPSEAYARGFLRIYANFLGMPADEVQNSRQCGSCATKQEEPVAAAPREGLAREFKTPAKPWLWSIAAICLAIVAGFFLLADKKHDALTENPSEQLSHAKENLLTASAVSPPGSDKITANPPQNLPMNSDTASADSPSKSHGIILKMRALEDGYLNLTIDDAVTQHYDLKAGDLIEWKADKVFSLDMENAGGVEAELNGKLLKPFGGKGAPAHIILTAGYDREKTER